MNTNKERYTSPEVSYISVGDDVIVTSGSAIGTETSTVSEFGGIWKNI